MKTSEIIVGELKKMFPEIAEEVIVKATLTFTDVIIPKLALEAEEAPVKAIAGILVMILPVLKPSLMNAIDKIDGHTDAIA